MIQPDFVGLSSKEDRRTELVFGEIKSTEYPWMVDRLQYLKFLEGPARRTDSRAVFSLPATVYRRTRRVALRCRMFRFEVLVGEEGIFLDPVPVERNRLPCVAAGTVGYLLRLVP